MSGRELQKAKARSGSARLPPRWFIVAFWHTHRALVNVTGGRLGLWRPKPGRWGALRLTTVGRRSGRPRAVLVGYFVDGDNFVTMAMNGWGEAEPGWWLNLQAQPDATVRTRDGVRTVHAHRAEGAERARLWSRWGAIDENLEAFAARRPRETAVVVLERERNRTERLQNELEGALEKLRRSESQVEQLRSKVQELLAKDEPAPPAAATAPTLSRQQRRAIERDRRKDGR